ncbi:MAG: Eco57I restriction-modification methylase domain-containing protein [Akkermansia sp.]|nr:Eco57I restriction-modification methylase domain-containing protein [Akkermansia sp.]
MPSLLNQAALATEAFVKAMPKTQRKQYGQFFTSKETAKFMAELFCLPKNKSELEILDAGAGSGILSIALIERLLQEGHISRIHLTCYETDPHILPILQCNLDSLISETRTPVSYEIKTENYITSQEDSYNDKLGTAPESKQYDMIIGNPPYMKISKNAPEAKAMSDVCHGAPNLYFLFATMGIMNLREDSEMVYIIPRSWTSGAYFKEFRKKLLSQCVISHIHLFGSRNKVFDGEQVLQETMILKVLKTSRKKETVTVTTSASNKDFAALTTFHAAYDQIVKGAESYVYLITDKEEEYAIRRLSRWEQTLKKLGLQMKTGLTVDFREKELLRQTPGHDTIPLFFPHHIKQGKVVFPIGKGNEYLSAQKKALIQRNSNYLFIKRFTAKEEPRRLQCGIYLARKYSEHAYISTQNKINFIGGLRDLSECVVYGLYVLFNSSIYDTYYRILNGSTQVNSTEMNNLPVPDLNTIEAMGKKLISRKSMAESVCNEIIENYIYE